VCPGPLVWFSAGPGLGAVLECAACGHIVTTGNLMDERHAGTPLLREGLASR
jgi:hypothetical protein